MAPTFPPPPPGVTFTDPIVNLGPDADHYRADNGSEHDSSDENKPISSFTPHISPLGLAFVIIGLPMFLVFIGIARVISLGEGRLLEAATSALGRP